MNGLRWRDRRVPVRRGMVDGQLTPACAEKLRELLAPKAGQREAVSFIIGELRAASFCGFPPLAFVEHAMRDAGFVLERVHVKGSGCVRATYVSLPNACTHTEPDGTSAWQEQAGEPPVDVCNQCGARRE